MSNTRSMLRRGFLQKSAAVRQASIEKQALSLPGLLGRVRSLGSRVARKVSPVVDRAKAGARRYGEILTGSKAKQYQAHADKMTDYYNTLALRRSMATNVQDARDISSIMSRTAERIGRYKSMASGERALSDVTRIGTGTAALGGIGVAGNAIAGGAPEQPAQVPQQKQAGFMDTLIGSGKYPFDPGVLQRLATNDNVRRALLGAAVGGTTAALSSDRKNRLRNTLIAAGLGGAGTYAASRSGVIDNLHRSVLDFLNDAKARELTWKTHGRPTISLSERLGLTKSSEYRRAVLAKAAGFDNVSSEVAGAFTAPLAGTLASALVGGALGSICGDKDGSGATGALIGAGIGSKSGNLASALGPLVAAIRKRRTHEEQVEHDKKSHWANLFVPGMATYNLSKRWGRAMEDAGKDK